LRPGTKPDFPRFHIGESLIPETYWVLKRLNMLPRARCRLHDDTAAGSRHGSLEGVVGAGVTHPERSSQDRRSTGVGIAHRSRFRANRNQMTPSLNRPRRSSRTSEQEFLRIADRVIARLLRVDCSIEQLQAGLGLMQQALADLERVVRDERLRS
jgi:hypothetical protein